MFRRLILALLIVLMVLSPISAIAVNAQDEEPPNTSTQIAPMVLDCGSLKGSALRYAKEHNYCPSNKGGNGDPEPSNVVWGNCGYSYLWVDDLGTGQARFRMGAGSTIGAMVSVSYNVSWVNWNTGGSGSRSGTDFPLSSTWSRSRTATTGSGLVTAVLSGRVTLVWGGTCTLLNPNDSETIH
jgi:hypothetical protein